MQLHESNEAFSWKGATLIMVLVSITSEVFSFLGLNPFSLIFNGLIIYLPTTILVVVLSIELLTDYILRRVQEMGYARSAVEGV